MVGKTWGSWVRENCRKYISPFFSLLLNLLFSFIKFPNQRASFKQRRRVYWNGSLGAWRERGVIYPWHIYFLNLFNRGILCCCFLLFWVLYAQYIYKEGLEWLNVSVCIDGWQTVIDYRSWLRTRSPNWKLACTGSQVSLEGKGNCLSYTRLFMLCCKSNNFVFLTLIRIQRIVLIIVLEGKLPPLRCCFSFS